MTDQHQTFDLDALVAQLKEATNGTTALEQVKSLLQDAVRDPESVRKGMPEFEENDVVLFEDESVSIWHCRFMPDISVPPHDHQMCATIAVYRGAERNDFFTRNTDGTIEDDHSVTLNAGSVLQIGPDDIHAVSCVSEDPCCGIHVYLGKLSNVERSLFDRVNGISMRYTDVNYQRLVRSA